MESIETILKQIDETKQIEVGNNYVDVSLIPVVKENNITDEFLKNNLGRKWRLTNQIMLPFCFKLYTTQSKKKPITILQTAQFWQNIKFNGQDYTYNQKDIGRLIKYCISLNIIYTVTDDFEFRYTNPNNNYGKLYIINNYNLKSFLDYNNVKVKWTKELVMKIPTSGNSSKQKKMSKQEQEVYDHFKSIYLEEQQKQTSFFKYYCNGERPTCEICYDNSLENLWKHNLTEREDGIFYREDKLDEVMGTERTVFDIQAELPNLIRLMNKGIICLKDRETFDFHSMLCGRPFTSKEDRNKQKIMCLTKIFGTKKDLQSLIDHFPGAEKNLWKYNSNKKWSLSSYKKRFMDYVNAANISLEGKTLEDVEKELLTWWDNSLEHFNSIVGKNHYKNSLYFIEGAIMMKLQNKLNDMGILTERVYDEVICKGKVDTKLIKDLYVESIKECGIKIKEVEE